MCVHASMPRLFCLDHPRLSCLACVQDKELLVLPPLTYELDLGKTPIRPISCENEIKVIQHFARVFKAQLARYPRTREEDEADITNGTYEFGTNHRNVIVVLIGEKIVCEYYVKLAEIVIPILQMPWKQAKKVMNKMYKDAGPDLLKYLQMVVTPLLKKRASQGGPQPAVTATPGSDEVGAGGGRRRGKKKGKRKK